MQYLQAPIIDSVWSDRKSRRRNMDDKRSSQGITQADNNMGLNEGGKMIINICGLPHKIIEVEETFGDGHCGEINYKKLEIRINKDLAPEMKTQTLYHEIIHGILTYGGYDDLSVDEKLVQNLAMNINQIFRLKQEGVNF